MFFKNLTFFRFPASFGGLFPSTADEALSPLEGFLAENPLRPCGVMEMHTRGFVSPFGREELEMVRRLGDFVWFTLGGEDKILPAAVVNAELAKKLRVIEQEQGRSPGGRARKRIKEEVIEQLLPRAFVRPGRVDAYFDFARGLLVCDTATRNRAEQVVSEVRHAVGSFPALPVNAETAPRAVLTGWLAGETMPEGLGLGESCVLQDPADKAARVTVRNIDLASEEVTGHLEAGMQCVRLALVLDCQLSFEIDEALTIRRLQFLDGAVEQLEQSERDDLRAELDARFALMTGEVSRLFDLLERAFRISTIESEDPSYADQGKPEAKPAPKRSASRETLH